MGSFTDKSFKPTKKIIIQEFDTAEDALAGEIELHRFFNVAINPHFANRANQTSTGFCCKPKTLRAGLRPAFDIDPETVVENACKFALRLEGIIIAGWND
jgi:hypothetical protein